MDNETTLLLEKIDNLSTQLENQSLRLQTLEANTNGILIEKLNYLTEQFEAQRRQQEAWNELIRDLIPVGNHMIKLSINELAEIGSDFTSEELIFLVKRLLRDTNLLVDLLDRLEATLALADEIQRIGGQVFNQTVVTLDRLERDGYFTFARGGWQIMERIVTEFGEEDMQALGDNIVTILTTVRNLTQPEIMSLTNNAIQAIQTPPAIVSGDVSLWSLLRDLRDPKVRQGIARLLNLVKALADQPANQQN